MNYQKAHDQVKRLWGPARQYRCIRECGKLAAHWAYDGTDREDLISRVNRCRYSPWPEFYMPLCARCHRQFDANWAAYVRIQPPAPAAVAPRVIRRTDRKPRPGPPCTEAEWDAWLRRKRSVLH